MTSRVFHLLKNPVRDPVYDPIGSQDLIEIFSV